MILMMVTLSLSPICTASRHQSFPSGSVGSRSWHSDCRVTVEMEDTWRSQPRTNWPRTYALSLVRSRQIWANQKREIIIAVWRIFILPLPTRSRAGPRG